jgi:hypothetical protein
MTEPPGDGPAPMPGRPAIASRLAPVLAPPGSAPADWALGVATLVRAAYGAALCCAPGAMLRLEGGPGTAASAGARTVARILGGRHIVQAVLSAARPTPAVLAAGAGTDVLHSASMIALAALDRPRRRLGLSDSLMAAAFAAGGWALARREAGTPVGR